jgi:hypothetical protein
VRRKWIFKAVIYVMIFAMLMSTLAFALGAFI